MSCWWNLYRDAWMSLTTFTTADLEKPRGGRVYNSDGFAFHESEIAGHFDEVEEQLFAFRNGLSNIVIAMTINPRFPANKYKVKHKASVILKKRVD